jgi:hypothetical protein
LFLGLCRKVVLATLVPAWAEVGFVKGFRPFFRHLLKWLSLQPGTIVFVVRRMVLVFRRIGGWVRLAKTQLLLDRELELEVGVCVAVEGFEIVGFALDGALSHGTGLNGHCLNESAVI